MKHYFLLLKTQIEEISDLLELADPPVYTEIYDAKKDEVIIK
jgi:hypothetical protein